MSAVVETPLLLSGLRCAGCGQAVERALRELPGVVDVEVNYGSERALVRHRSPVQPDALTDSVRAVGYEAVVADALGARAGDPALERLALARLLVAGFLAGNVMVAAFALYVGADQALDSGVRELLRWLTVGLSLPAVTWCAAPFWSGAWRGLRGGRLTVDVPIVMGISAAFVAHAAGTWLGTRHVFADSAAVIVFLVLGGRHLERGARLGARSAIEALLARAPQTALRWENGQLRRVRVEKLKPGDRVAIAAGETAPADAVLEAEVAEFDTALLTGESQPQLKRRGDELPAGAINLRGEVRAKVLREVGQSTIARLAQLLERAAAGKPEIQRQVDRVAGFFAPAVLLVASAVAGTWWWIERDALTVLVHTSAVLIVACPCALALATPTAISAALGLAARHGLLFQNAAALEGLARADAVAFDKTGTLSRGELSVSSISAAEGVSLEEVVEAATRAEGVSTHPLARALALEADTRGLSTPEAEADRESLAGLGVRCGELRAGRLELLERADVHVSSRLRAAAEENARLGRTLVFVADGTRALGVIALADTPRPDAADAVEKLREAGLEISLMTGDHAGAAHAFADRVGIDDWIADMRPEQKLDWVSARQAEGGRVIAAGDGINDAAALAAADVGVAFANGSDVTLRAADLVVHSPRVDALPRAVGLSRRTCRLIRQNLAFAVSYNAAAVALAAGGWLLPLHAAIAMGLSSLLVTLNALRARNPAVLA